MLFYTHFPALTFRPGRPLVKMKKDLSGRHWNIVTEGGLKKEVKCVRSDPLLKVKAVIVYLMSTCLVVSTTCVELRTK